MSILVPNYNENSIVSLMQNIAIFLENYNNSSVYKSLPALNSINFQNYDNIIMILVDGFGFEIFKNLSKENDFIYKSCLTSIDTVLPSTTISAITSFYSSLSPKEHGMLGWNQKLNINKQNIISQLLPFREKNTGKSLSCFNINLNNMLNYNSPLQLSNKVFTILPEQIRYSAYFKTLLDINNNSNRVSFYRHPVQCLKFITDLISNKSIKKKFIYSYLPHLDHFAHVYGCDSLFVRDFYEIFKKALDCFLQRIDTKKNLVIITADHGLLDTSEKDIISINDFTGLKEKLAYPVCGEARFSYFYVKEEFKSSFKTDYQNQFEPYGNLLSAQEMIDLELFGSHKSHSNNFFNERIGDFGLLLKKNYIFNDEELGSSSNFIGYHGSNSIEELKVPLIVFN